MGVHTCVCVGWGHRASITYVWGFFIYGRERWEGGALIGGGRLGTWEGDLG